MLQTHGWRLPSLNENDRHNIAPISPETIDKLQWLKGAMEGTAKHKQIKKKSDSVSNSYLENLSMHILSVVLTLVMQLSSSPGFQLYQQKNIILLSKGYVNICGAKRIGDLLIGICPQ